MSLFLIVTKKDFLSGGSQIFASWIVEFQDDFSTNLLQCILSLIFEIQSKAWSQ